VPQLPNQKPKQKDTLLNITKNLDKGNWKRTTKNLGRRQHKKLIHLHIGEESHPTYLKITMPKIESTAPRIKSNPKKKMRFSSSYT